VPSHTAATGIFLSDIWS